MTVISDLRDLVWEQNMLLPAEGLVSLTWGNVSGRAGELIAIKPSGVSYTSMRREDIVVLDIEGNRVAGELRPSTDTPTHI